MHLIARKRLSYAKHPYQIGETFRATSADARLLIAAKVATAAPVPRVSTPVMPPVPEAPVVDVSAPLIERPRRAKKKPVDLAESVSEAPAPEPLAEPSPVDAPQDLPPYEPPVDLP